MERTRRSERLNFLYFPPNKYKMVRPKCVNLYLKIWVKMWDMTPVFTVGPFVPVFTVVCQGWPNFRALLQIWGNCKFQIWGNAPNLGQKPILNLEFEWENLLSASHNYSWTCPEPSSLFLCALLATTIKRQGNIKKNTFWTTKISPNMGNWPKFGAIFLTMTHWPKFGAILQLSGDFKYWRKKALFTPWVRKSFLFRASFSYFERMNKILLELTN